MRSTTRVLLAAALVLQAVTARADDAADSIATAQELVDALSKGDAATASRHFDATMKKALPEAQLAEAWRSVEKQVGKFRKRTGARSETRGKYTVIFVTCEFEKTPLEVKVALDTEKQVTGLFFVPVEKKAAWAPPLYAKPDLFHEEEVTVGSDEWALPGTLTLPRGDGPFPAVVLVHGSGPNDRDETLGDNKAFRDLAWGLASRGIGVLRYDKRTRVHGAQFAPIMETFTVDDEVVQDAVLAVKLLHARKDVGKVFVLGHSLGGMLVPRIARKEPGVDGLIVMSGPSRPLEDLIVEQVDYLSPPEGERSYVEKKMLADLKAAVARVKDPALSSKTPSRDLAGLPACYWLDLRDYHPAEVAKTLEKPILVLQGERDYQVTLADFEGWKKALGEKKSATLKLYPRLNHHLMSGEGKPGPADYSKAGHVEPAVLDDIVTFVKG